MRDPLAVGLGALACGAGLGGGTIVTALFIVRLEPRASIAGYELSGGVFAGLIVAGGFGWWRSRSLENVWQRGVIGVMAAVAALLVGFLAWPIDGLLRLPGLVVWAALSFALGAAAGAWAKRGSRDDALPDVET